MYSATEMLASTISGVKSFSGGVEEGHFNDGGWREAGEGIEEDDAEDAGSCGYKDAGSSIATCRNSSSREMHVFDGASVLASSTDSDESTV